MYIDFNNFHCYNKKYMSDKSKITSGLPPYLYSVTTLPSNTYTHTHTTHTTATAQVNTIDYPKKENVDFIKPDM